MRTRLIGLPGTGKTTRLLEILDEIMNDYSPEEIIYCSYSNAAVDEAKERVQRKFGIDQKELKYFRTMHSLCMRLLNDFRIPVGSKPATYSNFSTMLNERKEVDELLVDFLEDREIAAGTRSWVSQEEKDDPLSSYTLGDDPGKFFLSMFEWVKATYGCGFTDARSLAPHKQEILDRVGLRPQAGEQLIAILIVLERQWKDFKRDHDLFEFGELLTEVLARDIYPKASILIVDEYQDSSVIQAKLVDRWAERMDRTIVAGDPNQAIYGFNGASPQYLENFDNDETILLHRSWRIPRVVAEFSQEILYNEWTKQLQAATEKQGEIYETELKDIEWGKYDSIYILGRTNSIVNEVEKLLKKQGIISEDEIAVILYRLYWNYNHDSVTVGHLQCVAEATFNGLLTLMTPDLIHQLRGHPNPAQRLPKESVDKLLRVHRLTGMRSRLMEVMNMSQRNNFIEMDKLKLDPKRVSRGQIQCMTMHASKGKEADLVVLITNASYYEQQDRINEEEEERVYFVAATRTRQDLALVFIKTLSYRSQPTRFLPSGIIM